IGANTKGEKALTNEPVYQGEPVLAVAAVDELTAAEAIEKIDIEFESLPFAVDPIKSLLPGGSNARLEGNIWGKPKPPVAGEAVHLLLDAAARAASVIDLAVAASRAEERRRDQSVPRRRLRQQGNRHDHRDHPGDAVEKAQCAGDDAHRSGDRALHRRRASRDARTAESRIREGRPRHRARYVRRQRERTVRAGWRHGPVRPHRVSPV